MPQTLLIIRAALLLAGIPPIYIRGSIQAEINGHTIFFSPTRNPDLLDVTIAHARDVEIEHLDGLSIAGALHVANRCNEGLQGKLP